MELVFFDQIVRHIARLSRALSLKRNGHAVLLSSSRFAGRHCVTRLIAHILDCSYFTLNDPAERASDGEEKRSKLRT